MDEPALFDVDQPTPPPAPAESDGVRRTKRQAALLAAEKHPLSAVVYGLRLHPDAAPYDDRQAPGRRCGNCTYRSPGTYPKCTFSNRTRMSSGPATDCRAWWPACPDHEWRTDGLAQT